MPMKMINILFLFIFLSTTNLLANRYTLKLYTDKKEVYLGDKINLQLLFTYDDLEDYELEDIDISNFELKELNSSDYKNGSGSFVEETNYELTPLKSGIFEIKNFKMNIETITKNYKNFNNRSKYTKKFSIFSNSLKISVKNLPKDISAIGNYTLNAKVDKKDVKVGEVLRYRIVLQGVGNIENLDAIELKIPNATTYLVMSSKSSKKHLLGKTFEIIADNSYTIPAFTLKYFDKKLGIVRVSKSDVFHIKVTNAKKVQKDTKNSINYKNKLLFFCLGALSTLFLIVLYLFYKKSTTTKKEVSFVELLKRCKSKTHLYKKIVVHLGKDTELDRLIYMLENKNESTFKNTKKMLIKRVKEINIC